MFCIAKSLRSFTMPKITTWKYLHRQLSRRIYLHCILLPEAVSNNKHRVDVNAQLISSNEYRLNSDFGVDRVLYNVARGKFNKISLIITRARERERERVYACARVCGVYNRRFYRPPHSIMNARKFLGRFARTDVALAIIITANVNVR